jgi:hypothetical protein
MYSIQLCNEFFNNIIKRYLSFLEAPGAKAMSILDEIDRINTYVRLSPWLKTFHFSYINQVTHC